MRPALQCLIKFIYCLADTPPFSAMWILVVLEELQGQLFCCVLETELLCPRLIWTLVLCCISQTVQAVLGKGWYGYFGGLRYYFFKMDSNKTIFLPLAMSSVTLVLDLTKGCWKLARTVLMHPEKWEVVFFFNVGHWWSGMRKVHCSHDGSVIWVGMSV